MLDGRVFLPLLLCGSAACGGRVTFDAWCNTPGRETSLLFYALATGIVGAAVVWWTRKRRLESWDLRESSSVPSSWRMVHIILAVLLVSGMVLSFALNGADDCAPQQRIANLRFTWLGIALAAGLCVLGLLGANWRYARR